MVDVMPYAQALYDVAKDESKESLFQEQLNDLSSIWKTNDELVKVLKHPKVKQEEKDNLLKGIVTDVDETLGRFIRVLVKHDLSAYVPDIYSAFVKCFNNDHNIECIDVESASELSNEQLSNLKGVLEEKLKKTVELNVKIDPSLIAGLRVRTDKFVLDNTVVSKAAAMKEQIKNS